MPNNSPVYCRIALIGAARLRSRAARLPADDFVRFTFRLFVLGAP